MRLLPLILLLALMSIERASFAQPLDQGDKAPHFRFKDIRGFEGNTETYREWVIVYTFADRASNKDLTAWIEDAGLEVAQRHPGLKIAYVNFADVSAVPGFLHYVVEPILRRLYERTVRRSREFYESKGIPYDQDRFAFHLIPDWDGMYLKAFGIKDASRYHCWIVAKDRVAASLSQGQPHIEKSYLDIFDTLAAASH